MKAFHKIMIPFFALMLCLAVPMSAQQQDNDDGKKIIIITKTIDEDGNEVVKKIVKEGAEAEEMMEGNKFTFESDEDGEIEIEINSGSGEGEQNIIIFSDEEDGQDMHINVDVDDNDGHTKIRIKGIDENGEEFDIEWEGEGEIPAEIQKRMDAHDSGQGMHKRHKRMKKMHFEGDSDSGFLGVMLGKKVENINGEETVIGESDKGVVVTDIVEGSAAEAAGLQADDIINSINGKAVKSIDDLTDAIGGHKAGEKIKVGFLRGDKPMKVKATLQARQHEMKGERSFRWESEDGEDFRFGDNHFMLRPCKPFIGVYLNLAGDDESGIAVQRVIPNTPAAEVNLQAGDIITAIDAVDVSSHGALIVERDKHKAGDEFTLTYLRDGVSQTVNATFPSCDEMRPMGKDRKMIIIKKKTEEGTQAEENINVSPEDMLTVPESNLVLNNFRSFPNPTQGQVTVRFQSEAGPAVVSISDITGKEVYREEMNDFDGNFNRQINLSDATPGTLLLTIRQGERMFTDKIILRKNN